MTRPGARAALSAWLALALFSACGVDSRGLTYEFHALDAAGSSAADSGASGSRSTSAGSGSAGGAGDDRVPAAGEGGAPNPPGLDSSDEGGSVAVEPVGGSSDNSPSSGAAGGGTPSNGGATVAETGGDEPGDGSGGSSALDDCGDANHSCGPTLVQNARFDTTVTGWVADPFVTSTWDATDSAGNANSGALLLEYSAPVVSAAVGVSVAGASQCIPTAPDTDYDIALRVMIAANQTGGQGGMNVWMYDDANCQGNLVSASTALFGGSIGQWTLLKGTLSVVGDVHSLSIRLVASKAFTQADLKIFVDDVLFAKH